jgi:hypothetical protein
LKAYLLSQEGVFQVPSNSFLNLLGSIFQGMAGMTENTLLLIQYPTSQYRKCYLTISYNSDQRPEDQKSAPPL